MSVPKAFISYSWDDESHKKWVAEFAAQLREDGIETILDQWHTVPGDQLPQFMEREIRENDFVIIICTPKYRIKSDNREGGVGYEGDIMTAEVHTSQNHRKFIPVLVRGAWKESSPSWLKGKYYIDLTKPELYEQQYTDLVTTMAGGRPVPPPVKVKKDLVARVRVTSSEDIHTVHPIKIIGIIVDEVTEPTMDGSRGCALYAVPFRLSRRPSQLWADLFVGTWNNPPKYTSMHRPEIASVHNDKIVLDGTDLEEIEKYHRDTLVLCVDEANKKEQKVLKKRAEEKKEREQKTQKHKTDVDEISKRLKF